MTTGLVVLIHGYGSSAEDMRREAGLADGESGLACLAWDAPHRCDLFPDKRQWFRLSALEAFLSAEIALAADALVERIRGIDLGDRPLTLLGHSQGGMIAAYIALTGRLPGSRAICVSTTLPFLTSIALDRAADLIFIHGEDDLMAPIEMLERQLRSIASAGGPFELVRLPQVGHKFEGELAGAARDLIVARHRRAGGIAQDGERSSGPS